MSKIPKNDEVLKLKSHGYTIHGPYYDVNLRGEKKEKGIELIYDYRYENKKYRGKIFIPDHILHHLFFITNSNVRNCSMTFRLSTVFETLSIQHDYNMLVLIYENRIGPKVESKTIAISCGEEHFLHALIQELYFNGLDL